MSNVVKVGDIKVGNFLPLTIFGGINVLESKELAFNVCEEFLRVTHKLGMPYVFKASFDKANRSSIKSFRDPGLDKGLEILSAVKNEFKVPIITDVHEIDQVKPVAEVADILQLPAFISRQTDLVVAMAATGKPINVKKAQFLAPLDMQNIINKCNEVGNSQVILCERGTMFGYNNLVVDTLAFPLMKSLNVPVIFDVTHALQLPGALNTAAGGRGQFVKSLAFAGVSQGLAGLFLETHTDPSIAKCDGACALALKELEGFLQSIYTLDNLVKSII